MSLAAPGLGQNSVSLGLGSTGGISLAEPIRDQAVVNGTPFRFVVPSTTFSYGDPGALVYSAQLLGGQPLSDAGLSFDAGVRTFDGVLPAGSFRDIEVIVSAPGRASVSSVFRAYSNAFGAVVLGAGVIRADSDTSAPVLQEAARLPTARISAFPSVSAPLGLRSPFDLPRGRISGLIAETWAAPLDGQLELPRASLSARPGRGPSAGVPFLLRDRLTLSQDEDTALSAWLPYVLPELPGCPRSLAIQHIRETLVDFCHRSRQWRYFAAEVPIIIGQEAYDLVIPEKVEVVQFETVRLDGVRINPASQSDAFSRVSVAGPAYSRFRNRVLLQPSPRRVPKTGLQVSMSLKPTHDRLSVPSVFFEDWRGVIACGAIATLKELPERGWTDLVGAAMKRAAYQAGRNQAKADAARAFDGATLAATGRQVLRSRRRTQYF